MNGAAVIEELIKSGVQFNEDVPKSVGAQDDNCGNCRKCLDGVLEDGWLVVMTRLIVCRKCGNKRCPQATDHDMERTSSNAPGQPGSVY